MSSRAFSTRALQEYFEALATGPQPASPYRTWHLIASFAELRYQLNGGRRCPVCRAHVRHVVSVMVKRADNQVVEFPCLCQRCLQAEQATADSVRLRLGEASWEVAHCAKRPPRSDRKAF